MRPVALRSGQGKTRPEGDRSFLAKGIIVVLGFALLATMLFSLAAGASDASVISVVSALVRGASSDGNVLSLRDSIIIWDIRLPRIILGAMIGASLAVSGAVMQGLFRNPLADPGIVGVSAGAGLGAVSVIVLGGTVLTPFIAIFSLFALPVAAFSARLFSRSFSTALPRGAVNLHRDNASGRYCTSRHGRGVYRSPDVSSR